MEIRTAASPKRCDALYDGAPAGKSFDSGFVHTGEIKLVYSHIDRIIVGGAVPGEPIALTAGDALRAEYFLQRREMGVINIGGAGIITVDGREYPVESRGGMYIGMGSKEIIFASKDAGNPARFYLNST